MVQGCALRQAQFRCDWGKSRITQKSRKPIVCADGDMLDIEFWCIFLLPPISITQIYNTVFFEYLRLFVLAKHVKDTKRCGKLTKSNHLTLPLSTLLTILASFRWLFLFSGNFTVLVQSCCYHPCCQQQKAVVFRAKALMNQLYFQHHTTKLATSQLRNWSI